MPVKDVGQLGFEDARFSARRRKAKADRLGEIDGLVDWSEIEAVLARLGRVSSKGEPAWPALVLFKGLLLQRWYDLSDEGLEAAVYDRMSFTAFSGLSLEDDVPDHSTYWRFREKLAKAGLMDAALTALERQFEAKGVIVKQGTLIDATLLQAAARRPRMDEGKESLSDPDARFGTSNQRGRFVFGYKAHVALDEGSLLVRAVEFTPANVQEIEVAPRLVRGDEACVLADRGYDGAALRDLLDRLGIENGIMKRGGYRRPVSQDDIARNHALAPRRRIVESIFGTLKRIYRMGRLRYFNQTRNAASIAITLFAYNLRRFHTLATA